MNRSDGPIVSVASRQNEYGLPRLGRPSLVKLLNNFLILLVGVFSILPVFQMHALGENAVDINHTTTGGGLTPASKTKALSEHSKSADESDLLRRNSEKSGAKPLSPTPPLSSGDFPLHGHDHDKSLESLRSLQELTKSPPLGSIVCPSLHFTPIYDKIVRPTLAGNNPRNETTSLVARKIPRVVHFSFNTRCVPNELAESITRWQEALPDHSVFFHDDEAVQRLIGKTYNIKNDTSQLPSSSFALWQSSGYFPELLNNLPCVKFKGAMLIDIWRMLVVWTYGGIYTDIDNWPGPKFNTHTIRKDDSFFSLSDGRQRPSQWMFGMAPNHPIAIFTLQDISRRLLNVKDVFRPRVVHITGPQTLKFGLAKFHLLLEKNATIFGKNSYFDQTQKIDLEESGLYAKGNLGDTFNDIVGNYFDERTNTTYTGITKRKKTELLSGVVHWTEDVKLKEGKIEKPSKVSCRDYLAKLG
mmetsp:Transcript_20981/g.47431  ORF Transcript_20981/g.47431 Transcript_20981/m.47431 type:complete len:471 (+) Transcript_20981:125-1537(+)